MNRSKNFKHFLSVIYGHYLHKVSFSISDLDHRINPNSRARMIACVRSRTARALSGEILLFYNRIQTPQLDPSVGSGEMPHHLPAHSVATLRLGAFFALYVDMGMFPHVASYNIPDLKAKHLT